MSQPLIFSKLFVTLTQKSVEDRRHFGKTQIKIWFFAQFALSLASITASHEVFGCQSLMKNVGIILLSVYSPLQNGVTLTLAVHDA